MEHDVGDAPYPPYEEMVARAIRAPSVHNTQPWLWWTTRAGMELHADSARQLKRTDPDGRDLLISCGAALHHLRVAAAALGWATEVRHGPDPDQPGLLAAITFARQDASNEAARLLTSIEERQTDRRRFASWPVPREHLESLSRHGSELGATVTSVEDVAVRMRLLRLTAEADERQRRDPAYVAELTRWARDRGRDGVPAGNVPEANATGAVEESVPQRFPPGTLIDEWQDRTSGPPGILVIATSSDDVRSRVRAGEALSAVWLDATRKGLVGVPLSQAIEIDQTRRALEGRELRDRACPQILLCVGWPRADRSPLPFTPRRPVRQVMFRG
jgi:nitroreductase